MALLQQPLQAAFAGQSLVFVADAQMAQGDCRVECAGAVIDGSLAQRWARAVSGLGLAAQEMPGLEPDANDAD
jgi:flagellar assembly protein FliH